MIIQRDGIALAKDVSIKDEILCLRDVGEFASEGSTFSNVCIQDGRGAASFGGGGRLSVFQGCRFLNCRFSHLDLGWSNLFDCSFVNCNIAELTAFEAQIVGCNFGGIIRRAIFSIMSEHWNSRRGEAQFLDNDFSSCRLMDADFRGGIDLCRQRFVSDGTVIVLDKVLDRLSLGLVNFTDDAPLTPGQLRRAQMLRKAAVDYRQQDVFLGESVVKRDPEDVRALIALLQRTPAGERGNP